MSRRCVYFFLTAVGNVSVCGYWMCTVCLQNKKQNKKTKKGKGEKKGAIRISTERMMETLAPRKSDRRIAFVSG